MPAYDADHWRERADEARRLAASMTKPETKREMHVIADAYERLADHAERTAGRRAKVKRAAE